MDDAGSYKNWYKSTKLEDVTCQMTLYSLSYFSQSVSQSVSLSVSQSVKKSVNQSVSQSVSLSVSQFFSHSCSQLIKQSISLSVNQSVCQSVGWEVRNAPQETNTSILNVHDLDTPHPRQHDNDNSHVKAELYQRNYRLRNTGQVGGRHGYWISLSVTSVLSQQPSEVHRSFIWWQIRSNQLPCFLTRTFVWRCIACWGWAIATTMWTNIRLHAYITTKIWALNFGRKTWTEELYWKTHLGCEDAVI